MDKGQGSRNQKAKVEEFKGYVTSVDSTALGLDVADDAINIAYDLDGGIRKREGIKQDTSFDTKEKEKMFFVKSRQTKTSLEFLEDKAIEQNENILDERNFFSDKKLNLSDKIYFSSRTRTVPKIFGFLSLNGSTTFLKSQVYDHIPNFDTFFAIDKYPEIYYTNEAKKSVYKGLREIFSVERNISEGNGWLIKDVKIDYKNNVYIMVGNSYDLKVFKNNAVVFDTDGMNLHLYKIGGILSIYNDDFYVSIGGQVVDSRDWKSFVFKNNILYFSNSEPNRFIGNVCIDNNKNIYFLETDNLEDNISSKSKLYKNKNVFFETHSTNKLYIDSNDNLFYTERSLNMTSILMIEDVKNKITSNTYIKVCDFSDELKCLKVRKDGKMFFSYKYTGSNAGPWYKTIFTIDPLKNSVDPKPFMVGEEKDDIQEINEIVLKEYDNKYIELDSSNHILSKIKLTDLVEPSDSEVFRFLNDSENLVVSKTWQQIKTDGINSQTSIVNKNIRYIESDWFNTIEDSKWNKDHIFINEFKLISNVFPEVKLKAKSGEVDFKYSDYLIEVVKVDNIYADVFFYKLTKDANGNEVKTTMKFATTKGIQPSYYQIKKSPNDEYSIATVGDSTILSTGNGVYSFIPIQNTFNTKVDEMIVAGTLNEFAEDVPYLEVIQTGLNRLKDNPLQLIVPDEKLNGLPFAIKDIIITEKGTDNIALFVKPKTDYTVKSQITVKDASDRDASKLTYEWKLSYKKDVDGTWADIDLGTSKTSKDLELTAVELDKTSEYQLELKVTLKKTATDISVRTKTLSFTTRTESIEDLNDIDKTNSSLWGTETEPGELQLCKYVANFDDKLVLYGNGTQQIYTSELGRPYFITATEIVKADSFGKGEDVVLIQNFKDTKIIFTKSTMMSMTGVGNTEAGDPYKVLPLDGAVGCVGHNAATPIENTLAFVGKDGIYVIEQISVAEQRVQLAKISSPINKESLPYFDVVDKVNEELMSDIVATNLEQRLIVSYPKKEYMLVFDYGDNGIEKGKWTKWVSKIVPVDFLIKDNVLYILDKKDKSKVFIKQPKITNETYDSEYPANFFRDNGNEYEFKYVSKYSDLGLTYEAKKIKRIFTATDNKWDGNVSYDVLMLADGYKNIEYHVDGNSYNRPLLKTGVQWGSLTTFRENHNIHSHIELISKPGRTIRVIIANNKDEPFALKGIQVEFTSSKAKGKQITK